MEKSKVKVVCNTTDDDMMLAAEESCGKAISKYFQLDLSMAYSCRLKTTNNQTYFYLLRD